MANYRQVKDELLHYLQARVPLVIIDTSERERVEFLLQEIASGGSMTFQYYTDAGQVCSIGDDSLKGLDVDEDPLGYFLSQVRKKKGLNIVLGDVGKISESSFYAKELRNLLYLAMQHESVVILVTDEPVWTHLSNFGMIITLDPPDEQERVAQIIAFIKRYQGVFPMEWDERDVLQAGTVLGGFTRMQIDNILRTEIIAGKGLYKENLNGMAAQKQKLYPSIGSVQHFPLKGTCQVSGMTRLKAWLSEKRKLFFLPENTLREYDLKAPQGILMVGVPGCGKSYTAKLVAQEWDLPLFRFDIAAVFDKWVGESERKMREALRFIENVSPCILWIDEIEKVLGTSDASHETGKRVLGEFLFWMQESDAKVFMVATANEVSHLPYELYRKGRFSEVFYAGLPKDEERREALRQYIGRSLKTEIKGEELDRLVAGTRGFSYSDIETAVKEVAAVCIGQDRPDNLVSLLEASVSSILPISRVNKELVAKMEEWGMERAIPVS